MPLSKPEILRKADEAARKNGSILSFRRFCPALTVPMELKDGETLDERQEQLYYEWLVTTGIHRALIEDPEWTRYFAKHLKDVKKITKTNKQVKKDMADEDEPLRGYFRQYVE